MTTENISTQSQNQEGLTMAPGKVPFSAARNMIAVASGKGGVGKTWFSITLAHALSLQGEKVLLFDGDLGLANIDIQLGLMPSKDLATVLAKKATLNQAIFHYDEGNFDIIAGRSGSGSLAIIPPSTVQVVASDLRNLSGRYDRVIVDLGAGIEKSIRLLAAQCATIFMVVTDEPTSLTDAYAFIKVISKEYPALNIQIIVNSANNEREGERTFNTLLRACKGFLGISPVLAGVIKRDTRVRDAIRNQIPLLSKYPTTDAAEDVISIAKNLMKD